MNRTCPKCENHCSIDNLRCGRGRRWKEVQENPELQRDETLKELFMECAVIARHRHERQHGQRRVLRTLKKHGEMTQREMAERFEIRPASLSELLIKLEKRELIQRIKLEEDRRNYQVSLTEKGLEALEELRQEEHKDIFEMLSDEEKETLTSILGKVKASWDDGKKPHSEHKKKSHHHHHKNVQENNTASPCCFFYGNSISNGITKVCLPMYPGATSYSSKAITS